jgi:hypothetical protein
LTNARTKDVVTVPDVRTERKLEEAMKKVTKYVNEIIESENKQESMIKIIKTLKAQIKNND